MGVTAAAPEQRGYHDPGRALRFLQIAVIVQCMTSAAEVLANAAMLFVTMAAVDKATALADLTAVFMAHIVILLVDALSWVACAAAFTAWVRRTVVNSTAMFENAMRSRRWSGLWILAPLANLVLPYLVVRDLWAGVRRRDIGDAPRPARESPPALVVAWWVTFVVGTGWLYIAPLLREAGTSVELMFLTTTALLAVGLLQWVLLLRVVRTISVAQREQRASFQQR